MAILCPHCQSEIGQESKFCPECGTRMPGKSRSSQGDGVTLNGCGTDVAVKDFPHSGLTSEMRQKVSVVAAEEKQRVAKFVEGLADATRLLQERRLVSCRRQVDGLLQLQGQLDVVDDPDCAKTMPAARTD